MAQRSVKSEYEVDRIRAAGDAAAEVYARVPEMIEEGLTEIELAGRITEAAYALGHQNHLPMRAPGQVMYSWHVISGASGGVLGGLDAAFSGYGLSPAFPMGASTKPIAAGEAVLIDFGLCLDGYMVDLTRMFALGEPPERVKAAYGALQEIEGLLTAMMKPEATCGELFDAAVKKAAQLGFDDAFIGQRGQKVRFVGHGVGLEINEPPILAAGADQRLRPGQVIALELKMTLPGLGAAGLENTVVVQSGGPIKLTPADEAFLVV
jgi:Xaa-Pro aminopeptidase